MADARVRLRAALAALGCVVLMAADAPRLLLREQAWTDPATDVAHALTHAPAECLAARSPEIEVGRALFRAPVLFGGPAARAGLSCQSCHTNGRVNVHFLLPELTDRAGAADVSSEWASRTLGDSVMNPLPIPDLVDVGARDALGQARTPGLEAFVRRVIEAEFAGEAPPPQALAALIVYLEALGGCAVDTEIPLTLADAAEDVRRALAATQRADPETADLLARATQDAIGDIVRRLPRARFRIQRSELIGLSRELGALRGSHLASSLDANAAGWLVRFDAAVARIDADESYFNEATLARAL